MRILITIPTWNEAVVIDTTLTTMSEAVKKFLPEHDVTIEVADNGSTDGTREIVKRRGAMNCILHDDARREERDSSRPYHILELHERGKGIAIRRSWEKHLNDFEILVFMDADLATDLRHLPELVQPLVQGQTDLVCGSRFLPGAHVERGWMRESASRLYRSLQHLILGLPVHDAQCGFKATTAAVACEVLPHCQEQTWLFDSELLAWAVHLHKRILEIPVSWHEYRVPERRSTISIFHDGWGFIQGLVRIRQGLKRS